MPGLVSPAGLSPLSWGEWNILGNGVGLAYCRCLGTAVPSVLVAVGAGPVNTHGTATLTAYSAWCSAFMGDSLKSLYL